MLESRKDDVSSASRYGAIYQLKPVNHNVQILDKVHLTGAFAGRDQSS